MPSYDDHYFMGKALEQARMSLRANGIPVGAVLAVPGRETILAAGHNRRNQDQDRTRHPACEQLFAEFLATSWGLDAWLGDIGQTT